MTTRRWITAGLAAAALTAAAAGCGSQSKGLSASASSELQSGVAAIQAAADSGNRTLAADRLAALRREVTTLEHQGQITSGRAAAILAAASSVQAQLVDLPAPTTTTTTTTTTVPTTVAAPAPPPAAPKPHHGDGGHGSGGDH